MTERLEWIFIGEEGVETRHHLEWQIELCEGEERRRGCEGGEIDRWIDGHK
jgi:hypothetical protein